MLWRITQDATAAARLSRHRGSLYEIAGTLPKENATLPPAHPFNAGIQRFHQFFRETLDALEQGASVSAV